MSANNDGQLEKFSILTGVLQLGESVQRLDANVVSTRLVRLLVLTPTNDGALKRSRAMARNSQGLR